MQKRRKKIDRWKEIEKEREIEREREAEKCQMDYLTNIYLISNSLFFFFYINYNDNKIKRKTGGGERNSGRMVVCTSTCPPVAETDKIYNST